MTQQTHSKLYFAYGSNMYWPQMQERCPSAKVIGPAFLKNYELAFTRFSPKRKCGVADIIEAENKQVWGVVYQVSLSDLDLLDRFEGLHSKGYKHLSIEVYFQHHQSRDVLTYEVQHKSERPILTNHFYKQLLIKGATNWKLPEAYITYLKTIPSIE